MRTDAAPQWNEKLISLLAWVFGFCNPVVGAAKWVLGRQADPRRAIGKDRQNKRVSQWKNATNHQTPVVLKGSKISSQLGPFRV